MSSLLDEAQIKNLFKEALSEVLQERRDLLYDTFAEVLEDWAMVAAIREGQATDTVDRSAIMKIFQEVE